MTTLADIQKLIPNYQDDILAKFCEEVKEGIARINTACKEFKEAVETLRPADGTLMSVRVSFEVSPSDDEDKPLELKYTVDLFSKSDGE